MPDEKNKKPGLFRVTVHRTVRQTAVIELLADDAHDAKEEAATLAWDEEDLLWEDAPPTIIEVETVVEKG